MEKTLLCITLYKSKRFMGKLFHYLHKLNPSPDMTLFVTNNCFEDIFYVERNYKLPYKIISFWLREDAIKYMVSTGGSVYDIIGIVRDMGLTYARRNNYDWIIYLDDDVYPLDEDFITKLLQWRNLADIIGGNYTRVYPDGIYVASKWATLKPGQYRLKKHEQVKKPFDFPAITSGGCLALNKKVIQDKRLSFYPMYNSTSSEDYGFCLKARKLGYKLILDNTTKLRHEYIETIKDVKAWSKKDGKYMEFVYK